MGQHRERISEDDDIPISIVYSRLIFEVAKINAQDRWAVPSDPILSRALAKDRSAITRQMKALEEAEYLVSREEEKYNRSGYKINASKILDLYLDLYEASLSTDYVEWVQEDVQLIENLDERYERLRQQDEQLHNIRHILESLREYGAGPMLERVLIAYLEHYAAYPSSGFTLKEAITALYEYQHQDHGVEIHLEKLQELGEQERLDPDAAALYYFLQLTNKVPIPRRPINVLKVAEPFVLHTLEKHIDIDEHNKQVKKKIEKRRKTESPDLQI